MSYIFRGICLSCFFCSWPCVIFIKSKYKQRQGGKPCGIYKITRIIWKSCITVCVLLSMIMLIYCSPCPVILKTAIWPN